MLYIMGYSVVPSKRRYGPNHSSNRDVVWKNQAASPRPKAEDWQPFFFDHIEIRRLVCHSLSYYWKDTRLKVFKYCELWSVAQILIAQVSVDLGSQYLNHSPWFSVFELQTCCSNSVVWGTEGAAVLVRPLQIQLPAAGKKYSSTTTSEMVLMSPVCCGVLQALHLCFLVWFK